MPLSHEEHEALLTQLNDPDITAEDRTEALTSLRNGHTNTLEEFEALSTSEEKLKTSNDDLLKANAKLFNSQGYAFNQGEDKMDGPDEDPSVSETVTLESMESKYR